MIFPPPSAARRSFVKGTIYAGLAGVAAWASHGYGYQQGFQDARRPTITISGPSPEPRTIAGKVEESELMSLPFKRLDRELLVHLNGARYVVSGQTERNVLWGQADVEFPVGYEAFFTYSPIQWLIPDDVRRVYKVEPMEFVGTPDQVKKIQSVQGVIGGVQPLASK